MRGHLELNDRQGGQKFLQAYFAGTPSKQCGPRNILPSPLIMTEFLGKRNAPKLIFSREMRAHCQHEVRLVYFEREKD